MQNRLFDQLNSSEYAVTLLEWIDVHHKEEDMRAIFLNLDRTLKYIHNHGYCIENFDPTEIQVLNNLEDHIKFKKLMELPSDIDARRERIKEDIFKSSLMQIGIYSSTLKYLNSDFLRKNFDSFSEFIPQGDIPYYRGVVQRGASVYFCEYALDQRNRELEELDRELLEDLGGKTLLSDAEVDNNKVNDVIYKEINSLKYSAFINLLLIPVIVLVMVFLFFIIMFIIRVFT